MENPLLTQAAALLTSVVRQQVALPCSLEQLEAIIHPLAHSLARQSAQQLAAESVAQAEAQPIARTPGSSSTSSLNALPRTSKFGYWSNEAQAGESSTTGSARPDAAASAAASATARSSVAAAA